MARSDRFMVALCTCRRSRTYPWCDTSHPDVASDPRSRPSTGTSDDPAQPDHHRQGRRRRQPAPRRGPPSARTRRASAWP
ncbi:CDGSH iron-sulfur domain-containing protein [Streptomyces sp. NPDC060334]|uniref:CDGSH iron-sulfur domain-containing protein n=1 Tax=Streptomyces sp. NPDC060334 TaxID=3347099 RepID=UPI00366324E4